LIFRGKKWSKKVVEKSGRKKWSKKVVEKNSLRGSDFFQVTPEELKALISKYGDTDKLAQSGVTIAGTRYMYLSSTDRVVRAKKGTNGVHAIKTQQSK
jgi:hypothetical protein